MKDSLKNLFNILDVEETASKEEIKKQYKKIFGNYNPVPFLCPWNDDWKRYYIENFDNIENKLELLKVNLDEYSKKVVDLIYKRYVFINPWLEYKDDFLVHTDKIFTTQEI